MPTPTPSAPRVGFPKPEAPAIDASTQTLTWPWYRFLANLWTQVGAGMIPLGTGLTLVQITAGLQALSNASGALVATVFGSTTTGATPALQTLTASPWVFKAGVPGTLLVFGGKVELQRVGVYYPVGLAGAALPLLVGDSARVTWYGPEPPTVTWLPSA